MNKLITPLLLSLAFLISKSNGLAQLVENPHIEHNKPVVEFPLLMMPISTLSIDIPNHKLMPNMDINWGVGGGYSVFPFKDLPLAIDVKGFIGRYSTLKERRQFTFDETTLTELEVQTRSNMNRAMLGLRYVNFDSRNLLKPYFAAHAGYAFMRSRIYIPDPEDEDDCAPIENTVIHRFNGFIYGGEAGIEFNLNKFRKDIDYKGQGIFLLISTSVIRGLNDFEYINAKHMEDRTNGPVHHHHRPNSNSNSTDLTTSFINISSREVHYHKVAELYRTPLQFISINCGLVIRL